jgi:hypothetical protein
MKLNLLFLSAAALVNAATAEQTNGAAIAEAVALGDAANYAILAKTGITNVPTSAVTGDMAVSPGAAATITAFDLVLDGENVFSESPQVTGKVYASDYADPTPTYLIQAVDDMNSTYTAIAGLDNEVAKDEFAYGGLIGGKTLTAGVYTFTADINIVSDVTFTGSATDVFVIRTTGNFVQAEGKQVILADGALAANIYWQVAGNVAVGAGAHLEGTILAKTHIVFKTESSLNGRILTQTACTLQKATITQP